MGDCLHHPRDRQHPGCDRDIIIAVIHRSHPGAAAGRPLQPVPQQCAGVGAWHPLRPAAVLHPCLLALVAAGSWQAVFTSTVWTLTYREIKALPAVVAMEEPVPS